MLAKQSLTVASLLTIICLLPFLAAAHEGGKPAHHDTEVLASTENTASESFVDRYFGPGLIMATTEAALLLIILVAWFVLKISLNKRRSRDIQSKVKV